VRILYFGTYERRYPRNAQVISCLRRAGVDVFEHHEPLWESSEHKWDAGAGAALDLVRVEGRLLARRPAVAFDALIVGYPGQFDLPAARRAAQGRPIVFNPLVSLTDTLVADRGRFRAGSLQARALEAVDRFALRSADLVVADTAANAGRLVELGRLEPTRVEVCYVGAEERIFRPVWRRPERFSCLFVGKLIPLHGLETIFEAARIASEIPFRIVGSGQLEALLASRPENVDWVPWVEYEQIPDELSRARCALGIFGTSDKARRVIPNKAFQALACGVPLVTADTPAARELLVDGESALLVRPGDPAALAAALRRLAADPDLSVRIAARGRAAYEAQASEAVLGARWRSLVEGLLP
jgi:glycosyltransferase involved in cell wall biosynthesis